MKLYEACEEVQEEFSALLDDELDPAEVEGVEAHLSTCAECLRELDSLKKMHTVYGALPAVSAPAGFHVTTEETSKSTPISLRVDPRHTRMKSYKPLFAAAAMFLLIATMWGAMQMASREDVATTGTEASASDSVFNVALVETETSETAADAVGTLEKKSMSAAPEPPVASHVAAETTGAEGISAKRMMAVEEDAVTASPSFETPMEPERRFATKRVDNRDIWTQEGYADQAVMTLTQDSPELRDILSGNPNLAKIVNVVDEVVFEYEDRWYRVSQ
jgi:predicted anti-sigma-YlaC factor YlaD